MLPGLRHALSHRATCQLAKKALEVFVEFLKTIHVAPRESWPVQGRWLAKNFLSDGCLDLLYLRYTVSLQNWPKLRVFLGQPPQLLLGTARLANTKHHMQHFFVERTRLLEGSPHSHHQWSSSVISGGNQGENDEFFDESYEVLLEVMKNWFFSVGLLSFVNLRLFDLDWGRIDAGQVIRLLTMLVGDLSVQKGLFV